MRLQIDPMRLSDLAEVREIEEQSFSMPWPKDSYRREIEENKLARYLVLRDLEAAVLASQQVNEATGVESRSSNRLFPFSLFQAPRRMSESATMARPSVVAYGGLWLMVDEAHITTIAVRPDMRGKHLGELMLVALIDVAIGLGARWVTLEVRVSNHVAQSLYRKYTFHSTGIRPRYYSDNQEDALVMWTDDITTKSFQELFRQHIAALRAQHEWVAAYPEGGGFLGNHTGH